MALLIIGGLILVLILFPWAYFQIRGILDYRKEQRIAEALTDLDPMTYTPIEAEVQGNTVTLEGRVPSIEVKNDAAQMVEGVDSNLNIENQITVVQVPPDAAWVATAIELVTSILNQNPDIDVTAAYAPGKAIVRGNFSNPEDYDFIVDSYEKLPGVEEVNSQQLLPAVLQERIYFAKGSGQLNSGDIRGKITPIQQFLESNADLKLKIIGHTDLSGEKELNQSLAAERAIAVQQVLENSGINPSRLEIQGEVGPPPDVDQSNEDLSRCVRFELLSAEES
ncbi:MAG: OmpA family protein [Kamptonema sp. SIO4C4]|nr:OmpA family protein [Kamptonema sp. SIO4C4]